MAVLIYMILKLVIKYLLLLRLLILLFAACWAKSYSEAV